MRARNLTFALGIGLLLLGEVLAGPATRSDLRGDRVGWARLKTPSPHWIRHSEADPSLMQFIRNQTTLNIDPTWYAADAENLKQLCTYPLIFAQSIHLTRSPTSRTNIAEYVRRGGFLLIDACINGGVTPDPDVFLAQQIKTLAEILPEARIVPLPASHDIYRCYFQFPAGRPPHTFDNNTFDQRWDKHGLYGIMIGSRMAGMITLSGLQCGWAKVPEPPEHDIACMKMLVNIYVYSMTQGAE